MTLFPCLNLQQSLNTVAIRQMVPCGPFQSGLFWTFFGFSVAHGGKNRHPFPVPLRVYAPTIQVLKTAVQKAKLGRAEELGALKRLDNQARQLERHATGPTVEELIAQERQRSPSYGGCSVFGWEQGQASAKIGHIDRR